MSESLSSDNENEFWMCMEQLKDRPSELIEFLRTADYPLRQLSQPWCITQLFECIHELEDPRPLALEVAQVFKERLGPLIMETEATICKREYVTIMDEFDVMRKTHRVSNWFLRKAFRQLGFFYARDVSPIILYQMTCPDYTWNLNHLDAEETEELKNTIYDQAIRQMHLHPVPYAEELIAAVFHPTRVSRWQRQNPTMNLHQYMM